jgi:hypothetical protein
MDGVQVYWTGYRHVSGEPQWTLWRAKAKHFTTARGAYEAAETHPEMNQAEWKAIKAGVG